MNELYTPQRLPVREMTEMQEVNERLAFRYRRSVHTNTSSVEEHLHIERLKEDWKTYATGLRDRIGMDDMPRVYHESRKNKGVPVQVAQGQRHTLMHLLLRLKGDMPVNNAGASGGTPRKHGLARHGDLDVVTLEEPTVTQHDGLYVVIDKQNDPRRKKTMYMEMVHEPTDDPKPERTLAHAQLVGGGTETVEVEREQRMEAPR